jgi:hypothetical protein
MKRLFAFLLIWTLLVVTGTIVSANSQTRRLIRPGASNAVVVINRST